MASRIEQIIDEIEDYIDGCKTQAFAPSKIIVNRETMEVWSKPVQYPFLH